MPIQPRYCALPVLGPDFPLPLDLPFTTGQARSAGVSGKVLRRLVADGYVRRLVKGIFIASQAPDDLFTRSRALTLVVPEHAVVVDWTAVWLITGLLPAGAHLETPPVSFFRHAGHGRLRNSLCASGERTFVAADLMRVGGLTVTTPLRTALDIGRLTHRDRAIGALDGLLRAGGFTRDELLAGIERFRGQRGVVQLRELAPLADGRAESPGESLLRLRWIDLPSLPRPEPQVAVTDQRSILYWLDLGVEELRYAVEYDGAEYHTSEQDRVRDDERRRWLRDQAGWVVRVVTKHNVSGPARDIEGLLYNDIADARRTLAARTRRVGTP